MQTLEEFLNGSDLAIRCRPVTVNRDGHDGEPVADPRSVYRFACELHGSNGDRPVRTVVATDRGAPDIRDVVDAVAAEAAVVDEARRYELWADQMGFDRDSRQGERAYRAARRQARLLRGLLGDERYEELLWEIERL
jgi:hypothetical protein